MKSISRMLSKDRHDTSLGENKLTQCDLQKLLDAKTWDSLQASAKSGKPLDDSVADSVAEAVLKWGLERGVQRWSHVVFPFQRQIAFKYNTFIGYDTKQIDWRLPLPLIGRNFSKKDLLSGSLDGSSLPHGGIRSSDRASAVSSWDESSCIWIKDDTMFIPCCMVSHDGLAYDEKTPFLRAQRVFEQHCGDVIEALGGKRGDGIVCHLGVEQEFYAVEHQRFVQRPDLRMCGRTLFGREPECGQSLSSHYFGFMNSRVKHFMQEFEAEAVKLGIAFIATHNEVGPSQHEWVSMFSLMSISLDQNVIARNLLAEVAARYGMVILYHEKPFEGLNGSACHCNVSVTAADGTNFIKAPKANGSGFEKFRFMSMMASLTYMLRVHGDVLRAGTCTIGNDERLGAQEAPPTWMSMHTGQHMEQFLRKVARGEVDVTAVPEFEDYFVHFDGGVCRDVKIDGDDRNRTAPFPWCGERIEMRLPGSQNNLHWPMTCLLTAWAASLDVLAKRITAEGASAAIRGTLRENIDALFSGNNYDPEWKKEALEVRKLHNVACTKDLFDVLSREKNKKLFSEMKVLNGKELRGRVQLMTEMYTAQVSIEGKCLLNCIKTDILHAAAKGVIARKNMECFSLPTGQRLIMFGRQLVDHESQLQNELKQLSEAESEEEKNNTARLVQRRVEEVRKCVDGIEEELPAEFYPYPVLTDVLYGLHALPESAGPTAVHFPVQQIETSHKHDSGHHKG